MKSTDDFNALTGEGMFETAKAVADLTIAIAEAEKKKRGSHVRKNTRKQAAGKST